MQVDTLITTKARSMTSRFARSPLRKFDLAFGES
jgi:hypothetical protein